jgi:D-alanine transaminase
MPDLAYVNGKIMPIDEAMVPIEDRGYQFADGVYEYIASYRGRLFMLEAHLNRLERSMAELDFAPIDRTALASAIGALFEQAGYPRAGIYIQITRGVAPRNHAFGADLAHQVVMTIRAITGVPPKILVDGATAITVQDQRWNRCDIKTIQLLSNSLAKQRAVAGGCDDAIFVSDGGTVREGTSSNVFMVSAGRLLTHPLTPNILPGITRMVIIDICREVGLPVEETFFDVDRLYGADEVFLTGTVTEVLPVVRIDGKVIGDGKVGPISQRLFNHLRERALAETPD